MCVKPITLLFSTVNGNAVNICTGQLCRGLNSINSAVNTGNCLSTIQHQALVHRDGFERPRDGFERPRFHGKHYQRLLGHGPLVKKFGFQHVRIAENFR